MTITRKYFQIDNSHVGTSAFRDSYVRELEERCWKLNDALRTARHYTECYGQKYPRSGATQSLPEIDAVLDMSSLPPPQVPIDRQKRREAVERAGDKSADHYVNHPEDLLP